LRQIAKWLKNWFFDSVNFDFFCVLFFVLDLSFDQAFFRGEKFFVIFKMASNVQDGGLISRERNFEIWQHFDIQSFMSLYFDQQHDPNLYFFKLTRDCGSIQDGGSILA
jgi:hypothetical protein